MPFQSLILRTLISWVNFEKLNHGVDWPPQREPPGNIQAPQCQQGHLQCVTCLQTIQPNILWQFAVGSLCQKGLCSGHQTHQHELSQNHLPETTPPLWPLAWTLAGMVSNSIQLFRIRNISQNCETFFYVTSHYSLVLTCCLDSFSDNWQNGGFTRKWIKIFILLGNVDFGTISQTLRF